MRVFDSLDQISADEFRGGVALAIGKFDGVHRGHRALIARVREVAEQRGLEAVVFTFANNPLSLLKPEVCPADIMSQRQRQEALAAEGVDTCIMVPFDAELAEVPAERFIEEILVGKLRTRHLSVGADFRFGRGGLGDASLLQRAGDSLGFDVEVIANIEDEDHGRVSSSRVREAVQRGDVRTATKMLGRPLTLRAQVVRGDARGRDLGFPTANLGGLIEGLRPADGVYAGWAVVAGRRYQAAISVGANVTFDPHGEPRVEAFLLDFDGDLYDQTIEVQFIERLRGMEAFENVDALIARMRRDVSEAREILAGEPRVN